MKVLSRTLSMVLCLQLAVGCQGEMFQVNNLGDVVGDDEVEISGSIARSFKTISDFILPSAVAAESGVLTISDATDPTSPVLLHEEKIENKSDYAIKLKREAVAEKLLKVEFVADDSSKNRVFLTKVEDKRVSASLSSETTAEHRVILAVLEEKRNNGEFYDLAEVKEAFVELKASNVSSSLNFLGDKEYLVKLLSDSEVGASVSKIVVEYLRLKDDQSTAINQLDIVNKLLYEAHKRNIVSKVALQCSGLKAFLVVPEGSGRFLIKFSPGKELLPHGFSETIFEVDSFEGASHKLYDISSHLVEYTQKLKVLGANLALLDEKGETVLSSCVLSNQSSYIFGPGYVDLTFLENFDPSAYGTLDEAIFELKNYAGKVKEALHQELLNLGFQDAELDSKLQSEWDLILKAIEEKASLAKLHFEGSYKSSYVDLSIFDSLNPSDFGNYDDFKMKASDLRDHFKVVISDALQKEGLSDEEFNLRLETEMVAVEAAKDKVLTLAYEHFFGSKTFSVDAYSRKGI